MAICMQGRNSTTRYGHGQCHYHSAGARGVASAVSELLDNEQFQASLVPLLRRHGDICIKASSIRHDDLQRALHRLNISVQTGRNLPCCLTGASPYTETVEEFSWRFWESARTEVLKAADWLRKHVCLPGIAVVPITNTAWLRAHWSKEHVTIKGSKTQYVFIRQAAAAAMRERIGENEPTEAWLLELLPAVLGVYVARETSYIEDSDEGDARCLWAQTAAETLALNIMLWNEARIRRELPVFGGDFNQHIIAHPTSATEVHCAAAKGTSMADRQLAL
ncbi:hypothetical protein WJX72_005711 [[Myrmecia] bisecta]|uniref:Uncharacterized protein n=1 Tax=[Myrmecia] bisecta TaxID=41462 RepID=A0AAW1P3R1_9CHLO